MGKIDNIIYKDVLIIGAGIAGLTVALNINNKKKVLIVAKSSNECSTIHAQGGIAVALSPEDNFKSHFKDTVYAGAGLCTKSAVKVLVKEGVPGVKQLIKFGARFDRTENGFNFTKEGAHSHSRILHAGDSTGKEILSSLQKELKKRENIEDQFDSMAVSLIMEADSCYGAIFLNLKTNKYFVVLAGATVLATGGYVQCYKSNTNPAAVTGDGIAIAYRAGAVVRDMEFVQFHPTTLYMPEENYETAFLISEAVRGEGAILRNVLRYRFMADYHAMGDLAPRDVVSRAIINEMHKTNASHVLLDLSAMKINVMERFPEIYRRCKLKKINMTKDLVPVVPAAHYSIGGIKTDLWARTNLKNLYACGETSSTGVHGANRLASNSLLEGLVFGARAATVINAKESKPKNKKVFFKKYCFKTEQATKIRETIKDIMWQNVGIVRDQENLNIGIKKLGKINKAQCDPETKNLLLCAKLTAQGALLRSESRGAHYRSDHRSKRFLAKRHTNQQLKFT